MCGELEFSSELEVFFFDFDRWVFLFVLLFLSSFYILGGRKIVGRGKVRGVEVRGVR